MQRFNANSYDSEFDRSPMKGQMRDYVVLSLADVESGHSSIRRPHILLSIGDADAQDPRLTPSVNRLGVLRLQFDDVGRGADPDEIPFDDFLARDVADFVLGHEPSVRIVAHCFAGIRRSAGMVAGLAQAVGDLDVRAECHRRYMPNTLVEELTLRAVWAALSR